MSKKRGPRKTYGACSIEGCTRPSQFKHTALCGPCYHSLYYHTKRGVKHVMEWAGRLSVWSARARSVKAQMGVSGGRRKRAA